VSVNLTAIFSSFTAEDHDEDHHKNREFSGLGF
jgi:hypothetical protein